MKYWTLFILLCISCSNSNKDIQYHTQELKEEIQDTVIVIQPTEKHFYPPEYNPEEWTEFIEDSLFTLDIRYATENNFMKQKIYDCSRCFLRPVTAERLKNAAKELYLKGYKVVLFDCYRPRPFQQKLWDIMPNAMYVTPPSKGSMHNRGHAVDIGLIEINTNQLIDFGTDYDYFGKEAHYAFAGLSDSIKDNRILLRGTMEKYGFTGIRTEWWHFSYKKELQPFSDWLWECEN